MSTFKLTKDNHITCSGGWVSSLYEADGIWTAIGGFGEVYARHADRVTCAKLALKDPRLGTVPVGAAR